MPLPNAKTGTLSSYVESQKLHNLYFDSHTCICVSFLLRQWKHFPKLAHCFYFASQYSHISHHSPPSGKALKGEEMMDCPFFPFPFMSFSVESVANSGEWHK